MKTFKRSLGIAASIATSAMLATSAFGQGFLQTITLDENGNGYITVSQPFPFAVAPDPMSGITTLVYTLPFAGVAGDVLIQESVGGQPSDLLRFDGNGHVYFFSDNTDGIDNLADSGLPTVLSANIAGPFLETGVEGGFQHYVFAPAAGQPGYKAAGPVQYDIISDVVPEPASLGLVLLGCGSFLMLRKQRRDVRS